LGLRNAILFNTWLSGEGEPIAFVPLSAFSQLQRYYLPTRLRCYNPVIGDRTMSNDLTRIRKPRCILVYALAPDELSLAEANQQFNAFIADRRLPMVLFHDHFIGSPGGVAIFFAKSAQGRQMLMDQNHLPGWQINMHPLIYSFNPAAFDEQIAFTLRAYSGEDWEKLRATDRPDFESLEYGAGPPGENPGSE
jgi:hypothetical protein